MMMRTTTLAAALLLAACSSTPPTHFHSLMTAEPPAASAAPTDAAGGFAWELLPVAIPAQLDRPQLVLRDDDGSLSVAEYERWIAPLAEELHDALAERLTRALGVSETSWSRRTRWRVRIDVQRLDSMLGRGTRLQAEWRLRSSDDSGPSLRCSASYEQPVAAGHAAIAAGHRAALARLAADIAATLKAVRSGRAPTCGAAPAA